MFKYVLKITFICSTLFFEFVIRKQVKTTKRCLIEKKISYFSFLRTKNRKLFFVF